MLFNQFTIGTRSVPFVSLCRFVVPRTAFSAPKFDISAINVDDALVQRAAKSPGDIWLEGQGGRGSEDGVSRRGAESAMRAMPTRGFTNSRRVFRREDGHARSLYAEQPRRAIIVASTLPIFPVSLAQSRRGSG